MILGSPVMSVIRIYTLKLIKNLNIEQNNKKEVVFNTTSFLLLKYILNQI